MSAPAPTVTTEQEHRGGVTTSVRERIQQFLAFASLIVIFVFFSIASPWSITSA